MADRRRHVDAGGRDSRDTNTGEGRARGGEASDVSNTKRFARIRIVKSLETHIGANIGTDRNSAGGSSLLGTAHNVVAIGEAAEAVAREAIAIHPEVDLSISGADSFYGDSIARGDIALAHDDNLSLTEGVVGGGTIGETTIEAASDLLVLGNIKLHERILVAVSR